ncbi:MAG: IS1182 family transposase [Caulobacteraceae bacterium]|nr:IS1182 family transposase [Caulobacteraceae bacterium]
MKRFVEGEDRRQGILLPEFLDDWVSEENPVRAIDVFVDELDLDALGFEGVEPAATGRPGYHPGLLLKLYIYGYLNQVASSRRLEREAQRNVELMWLTGRLAPDFKTIADFRKDNGVAIRAACRRFVELCRKVGLFAHAVAAIDGSRFKAVNTRDKNFTRASILRRMEQVEASIARYLAALETADRQEGELAEAKAGRLKEKIASLREQMRDFQALEVEIHAAPGQQISLTDPDCRAMATNGKGTGLVGYNVQVAVDVTHHLVVAHEVTNVGHDRTQLEPMALKAREAMGCEELTALADRGYYNGEQVLACEGTGVLPCIPKIEWPSERGLFTRRDFVYDARHDHYTCPAGQKLTRGLVRSDRKADVDHYRHLTACFSCVLKPRCTPDKLKRLKRWEHEAVLDRMQERLDRMPKAMRIRRATVEHVFGTLKAWMGATHFKMRSLEKAQTEMSLHVLAYNLKRMISILGVAPLIQVMRA